MMGLNYNNIYFTYQYIVFVGAWTGLAGKSGEHRQKGPFLREFVRNGMDSMDEWNGLPS